MVRLRLENRLKGSKKSSKNPLRGIQEPGPAAGASREEIEQDSSTCWVPDPAACIHLMQVPGGELPA